MSINALEGAAGAATCIAILVGIYSVHASSVNNESKKAPESGAIETWKKAMIHALKFKLGIDYIPGGGRAGRGRLQGLDLQNKNGGKMHSQDRYA